MFDKNMVKYWTLIWFCWSASFSKLCPYSKSQISTKKTHPFSSKFRSVCALYHAIIQDLKFCMPSIGKWAMAPSHVTERLLPPPLHFSHPECFPAQPEEEAKGLLLEVSSFPCPPFSLPCSIFQLMLNSSLQSRHSILTLYFFLQGLESLQQASQLQEEAWKLEERVQQLETEGWRKMWEAVAGSEVEGLYGLLRRVTSHSPIPSQPHIKKALFCPQHHHLPTTPQESTGPEVSEPADQATGPASPAAPSAPEEAIPAHMQPLQTQVGGIKRVYKCWVEECKEDPSASWATICAHIRTVHLGVRLVCSLCGKTFFNQDVLRCHKKPMLINKGNH